MWCRKRRESCRLEPLATLSSKRIPDREGCIAAVKVLQRNHRQPKGVCVSGLVESVIIPRHFVTEPACDIDHNRGIRPLIVEIERAGRSEWVQENRIAADK